MIDKKQHEIVRLRVKAINKELFASGMILKDVDAFWKQCIKEVRKEYIMGRFFDGLSDGEIAREAGYCTQVISNVTRKHWEDKMKP